MKASSHAALLMLFSSSVSYGFVNTRCTHPSDPSHTDFQERNAMPELPSLEYTTLHMMAPRITTVTSTLSHVDVPSEQLLPTTPLQSPVPTIRTPWSSRSMPTPPKSHTLVRTTVLTSHSTSNAVFTIASNGSVLHSNTSSSTSAAFTQQYPANDNIGPGINNVPIKHIKGEGQGGKKITYPNKKGSNLCKKARKCITIDKIGPIRTCLEDLQAKVHLLAQHKSNITFAPLEPIACSPAHDSKYCAYVELVPWQPRKESNERAFQKMNIQPYTSMKYNAVPIGAIKEGVDWIKQGKAKLCGESLLPVPLPVDMHHPQEQGKVYTLKIDVDPEMPDMSPTVIAAYNAIEKEGKGLGFDSDSDDR